MELVGKGDLRHDHGADSDHDKRPGNGEPAHVAIGHELAVSVHAAADRLVAGMGLEPLVDAHHQRGCGQHDHGRDDEHTRGADNGQKHAADAGSKHESGTLEHTERTVGAAQVVLGHKVWHGALDSGAQRSLSGGSGDHHRDHEVDQADADQDGAGEERQACQASRDHDHEAPVISVSHVPGPRRDRRGNAEDREHGDRHPPRRVSGIEDDPDQRCGGRSAASQRQPLADGQAADCGADWSVKCVRHANSGFGQGFTAPPTMIGKGRLFS